MKILIICAVLFALTYNVNGAFVKVESNDLMELIDLLDQYGKQESAPVASLDDEIEDFLTSLLNMNDRELEGFFSSIGRGLKKAAGWVGNKVKQCANSSTCKNIVKGAGKAALGLIGKK